MPKFTPDDVKNAMGNVKDIRNVAMMGPFQVGKTCAMDCLGAQCGCVSEEQIGDARFTHTRDDEKQKGSTIKSNLTTMLVGDTLLHCVDTPGHTEYIQELQIVAPLCDGALFVVDGSKMELAGQVSQLVSVCNAKAITPVLVLNMLDTSLLVTQKPANEILDDLVNLVELFNQQMTAKDIDGEPPSPTVSAEEGSVIIGSLKNGWAFSLPQMANTYSKKFSSDVETMSKRLWGENYFNAKKKTWTKSHQEGSIRGFEQLVLMPIAKILEAAEGGEVDKVEKMLGAVGATMSVSDKKFTGKALFHRAMQLWMPAGICIANALKQFVPNPIDAQKARYLKLINGGEGAASDPSCVAVKDCKANGPMLFQVCKLVPQPGAAGRFYALGRVFSGTLSAEKCFCLEEDFIPKHIMEAAKDAEDKEAAKANEEAAAATAAGPAAAGGESPGGESPAGGSGGGTPTPKAKQAKSSGEQRSIQGVVTACGKNFDAVRSVPAGNLCLVSGIDQYVLKRCTVAASTASFPLSGPAITVSPVVRRAVEPKTAAHLPKMVEALRRLAKTCPIIECKSEDNGKYVLAAGGAEHMRVLKSDLENEYMAGIELVWGDPSISYRETVTAESSMMCLSKSPNKHNRLFIKAEPLAENLNRAIETGLIFPTQDVKARAKKLKNEYDWDIGDGLKIWGFGPAPEDAGGNYGANVLVDQTKAIQYLNEIKESVNSGLLWASRQGVLAEENMRGVRLNLHDVKLHTDSIHRGMGQIQPTARRVFFAAMLTAEPRFQEPVFLVSINAPADVQPGIMSALGACRGEFLEVTDPQGGQIVLTAYVPIAETIGSKPFATVLTEKTNGKGVPTYAFDHWDTMKADPLDIKKDKQGEWVANGKAAEILLEIRKRKGLKVEKPDLLDYFDKL